MTSISQASQPRKHDFEDMVEIFRTSERGVSRASDNHQANVIDEKFDQSVQRCHKFFYLIEYCFTGISLVILKDNDICKYFDLLDRNSEQSMLKTCRYYTRHVVHEAELSVVVDVLR